MKKIVLIGAGSVSFTQGLLMDIIKSPMSTTWEVALVDINEQALDTARKLAAKMIEQRANGRIRLSFDTERKSLLSDADYVVTTIGVGSRRAWEQDVFIPRKYGVYQPVGDTVMPGGISRAMRMIPAMVDIADDVLRLAPKARFFNYSNPMAMICRAVRKKTAANVTGLCHGVPISTKHLINFMGIDPAGVSTHAVGLNHLTFIYEIYRNGQSLKSLLMEKIHTAKAALTDHQIGRMGFLYGEPEYDPLAWELFLETGAYPVPGDRHITEYYADRFPKGSYYGKKLGADAFSFELIIERGDKAFDRMRNLAESPEPLADSFFQRFSGEHEHLLDIIADIDTDARSIHSVNLPNGNAYGNLPADAVLELPAMAWKNGLLALSFDNFPGKLVPTLKKHIDIVEATVDAALTGDRRLFAEAIRMGGYLSDDSVVGNLVEELICAQNEFLPQF